jgi:hypothetical protein
MAIITLSILERLQLLDMLPKTGRLIEMELVQSIIDKVRFSATEISEYALVDTPDGHVSWDKTKARDYGVMLENAEIKILRKIIRLMDNGKLVSLDNLPLVKKILAIEL